MSRQTQFGLPFRGEVSTADASAGVTFTLYDAEGNVLVLPSVYQMVIYAYSCVAVAAGNQCIGVADTAGNRLRKGTFSANSGLAGTNYELVVKKTTIPKFFAAAGQADAQIEGRIIKIVA